MSGEPKRAIFSADEKESLKILVKKYKDILENKKTDCVSVSQKKKTWIQLAVEYNSLAENSSRTPQQLKKCWENLKNKRKMELSLEKRERLTTGGGSFHPPADDPEAPLTDDILGGVDIELKDVIDSDIIPQEHENECIEAFIAEDIPQETSEVTLNSIGLEKTQSSKRKTYVGRGTAIERELAVRLDRIELLKKQEAELHAAKMQEQQLRIKEAELKLLQTEEEGRLRIEILKEQLLQEHNKRNIC
ncbi:hypothetical protein RN001_001426 [Aquatica leii]|uniref:Myb/SANT-like DNA-binding domain-containing protein 3 n=1 Tax=Aquatica leii TaxID=1421715 RepID=A0AAN7QAD4_9COLE|nr:hypothetical protein RN001_001426 [Aquatica leii]